MLKVLRRFIPPYRWQVAANLFFNILSTVLSLFSFATIIPVLQILFGLSEANAVYVPMEEATNLQEMLNILNYGNYLVFIG